MSPGQVLNFDDASTLFNLKELIDQNIIKQELKEVLKFLIEIFWNLESS